MLPSNVTKILPYIGIAFLILAIIFEIISAAYYPTPTTTSPAFAQNNTIRFHNFAIILSITGVGLFIASK